jgi:hypothetical protein
LLFASVAAVWGCAGGGTAQGTDESEAAPELFLDAGPTDGVYTLTFVSPMPNAVVTGEVPILVRLLPPPPDDLAVTIHLPKLPLTDTDPAAAVFSATWESTEVPDGFRMIRAIAELPSGEVLANELPVIVRNEGLRNIDGGVYLTSRVRGAKVDVMVLDDNLDVESFLASFQAEDDEDFVFQELPLLGDECLLLRATGKGATYELDDGSTEKLGSGNALTTIVDMQGKWPPVGLSINAWTTMAAELSRAYRRSNPAWSRSECIAIAYERVGAHLWRSAKSNVEYTVPLLPHQGGFQEVLSGGIMGLSHAGIALLARDFRASLPLGTDLRTGHLVDALARDLSNGLFDGLELAPGSSVPRAVLVADAAPIDSETTRGALAEASYRASAPFGNLVDQKVLFAPGGLYHNMATDSGPLYPPNLPATGAIEPLAPSAKFTAPTPVDGAARRQDFQIGLEATDNVGLASVTLEVGSLGAPLEFVTAPQRLYGDADSPLEVREQVDVKLADIANDGPLRLTLTATDKEGVTSANVRTVMIDRQAPVFEEILPKPGEAGNVSPLVLRGKLEELPVGSGQVEVAAWIGADSGAPGADAQWTSPNAAGEFELSLWLPQPGVYPLQLFARDAAGNVANASSTYTHDVQPPTLVVAPVDTAGWSTSAIFTVKGTLGDTESGPQRVEASAAGTPPVVVELGPAPLSDWALGLPAGPAQKTWTIRGYDRAGNPSLPVTVSAGLDNAAPELHLVSPSGPVLWTNQGSLAIEGSAVDEGAGVAQVFWRLSAGTAATPVANLVASAEPGQVVFSHLLKLPVAPNGKTIETSYLLEVWAVDKLGQSSAVETVVINVDTTPPEIALADGPTFVNEDLCEYLPNGEVDCAAVSPQASESMLTRCSETNCGEFTKYLDRFGHEISAGESTSPGFLKTMNIPVFGAAVFEENLAPYSFSWRLRMQGGAFTTWHLYDPESYAPLLWHNFTTEPFGEGSVSVPLPNAIEFVATDLAGNQTLRSWTFSIVLVVPPPLFTWEPAQGATVLEDGSPWGFDSETAHLPFASQGNHVGIRVGSLEVTNTAGYPVVLSPSSWFNGVLKLAVSSERRYSLGKGAATALPDGTAEGCWGIGKCRYFSSASQSLQDLWQSQDEFLNPTDSNCGLVPRSAESTAVTDSSVRSAADLEVDVQVTSTGGVAQVAGAPGDYTLAGGAKATVEVYVSIPGTCILEPPITAGLEPGWPSVYLRPSESQCATTTAMLNGSEEYALCYRPPILDPEVCKFFPSQCIGGLTQYRFPYIVTSLHLGEMSANSGTLQLSVPTSLAAPGSVKMAYMKESVAISLSIEQTPPGNALPWKP